MALPEAYSAGPFESEAEFESLRAAEQDEARRGGYAVQVRRIETGGKLFAAFTYKETARPAAAAPSARARAAPSAGEGDQEDLSLAWTGNVPLVATDIVKRFEGFFAAPYDDNGHEPGGTWTIGYGSIVDAAMRPVTPNTPPVSEAQAVALLRRDMGKAALAVKRRVAVQLTVHEAASLVSWTYNLGEGNLASSTLLKRLNAGEQRPAVAEEMKKWVRHEGKPLLGLLRRRWAEAAVFRGATPTVALVRAWKDIDSLDDWPAFPV